MDLKSELKKRFPDIKLIESTLTVNCALENVIRKECTMKSLKIETLRRTTVDERKMVDLSFYSEYTFTTDFMENIQVIVRWVSDLKMIASSFNSYLWMKIYDDQLEIPEINDKFFTLLFQTVRGQRTQYAEYFDQFIEINSIGYYFPWLSGVSQILCHVKNEMTTVALNNIILNFTSRMKANIRWRLCDQLSYNTIQNLKQEKSAIQDITDYVYNCLAKQSDFNDHDLQKFGTYISATDLTRLFSNETELIPDIIMPNLNNRKNQLKQKKGEQLSADTLTFQEGLEQNPQLFLKLLYIMQQYNDQLQLSAQYRLMVEQLKCIPEKEDRKEFYKYNWKWTKIRLPEFKLMPMNDIKCNFVRIDKKSLFEFGIPICNDGSYWWHHNLLDVYSHNANIRQLRREKIFRCPQDIRTYFQTEDLEKIQTYLPWIPGKSFLTNGIQCQIPLLTIQTRQTHGLAKLFQKGYSGFKKTTANKQTIDINGLDRGIYHIDRDKLHSTNINDLSFIGIDPGRIKPLSACLINGDTIPVDWRSDERKHVIHKSMQENEYITHKEYSDKCGFDKNKEFELKRRKYNTDYDNAIKSLSETKSQTAIYDQYNMYTQRRFMHWNTMRTELFYSGRLKRKFESHSTAQSAIAHFGETITKRLRQECDDNNKQGIVVFGNGTFRPGGTGYASVPKKATIREIATRFPVLIISETYTSKKCPISFRDIKEIENESKKARHENNRIRRCATVDENNDSYQFMDRDACGSVNIAQKAIYKILSNDIPHFEFI